MTTPDTGGGGDLVHATIPDHLDTQLAYLKRKDELLVAQMNDKKQTRNLLLAAALSVFLLTVIGISITSCNNRTIQSECIELKKLHPNADCGTTWKPIVENKTSAPEKRVHVLTNGQTEGLQASLRWLSSSPSGTVLVVKNETGGRVSSCYPDYVDISLNNEATPKDTCKPGTKAFGVNAGHEIEFVKRGTS